MGEVSGGLLLVSGEQRVCCGLSNLLTKACDLIGPNPPYPAISLGKGQDKSVGTRKTNKLQMWSEVQSGKEHCRAESCWTKHDQNLLQKQSVNEDNVNEDNVNEDNVNEDTLNPMTTFHSTPYVQHSLKFFSSI